MKIKLLQDSRDKHAKDYFGAITTIPDTFELDKGITNPIEANGGEYCTAISATDVCGNQTGTPYNIDDLWALTPHTVDGADPRDSMGALIKNGLQPLNGGPRDNRWKSYFRADGNAGNYFQTTQQSMLMTNSPTTVNSFWYDEWSRVGVDGVLPQGKTQTSAHSYEVTGWKNGMFHVKHWRGYFVWMPQDVFNTEMDKYGTSAFIPTTTDIQGQFKKTILQFLIDAYRNLVLLLQQKVQTSGFPPLLYTVAKGLLGQHLTLNDNVPPEVGCAECLSYVLKQSGYTIPTGGIPGTSSLYTWLKNNPRFQSVSSWQIGDIILSPTGMGNGKIPGHVGVMGTYGIMSNDSNSGLFLELWTIEKWKQYYAGYGGLPIYYFRPL